jgi:hypothetical protein
MTFRKSGIGISPFEPYIDTALIVFFSLFRFIWLYCVYGVGIDQAVQMNVAFNIMDGRGIVVGPLPGDTGGHAAFNWMEGKRLPIAPMPGHVGLYTPYNWFPPGISFLLIPFHFLTGNIFLSEYLLKCVISGMEGLLLVKIIGKYMTGIQGKALLIFILAFYTGHIDRAGVSDMFCGVAGLWLMWVTYRRISTGVPLDRWTILLMAAVMPSMVLVKYNAIAIVLLPMGLFILLVFIKGKWILSSREWVALFVCTSLSVASLIWSLTFISSAHFVLSEMSGNIRSHSAGRIFSVRLNHLLRLDTFWLHFGKRMESVFKAVYGIIIGDGSEQLDAYRFWQVLSLVVFLTLLFLILRKSTLDRSLSLVLLFASAIHVVFLSLLTLFKGPDVDAKYGVDGLIWTYIEEPRFFCHLALAFTLVLLIGAWKHVRLAFWLLSVFLFYNTLKTTLVSKSDLGYHSSMFRKMYPQTYDDVSGEIATNRKAYLMWAFVLGRGIGSSSGHSEDKE